MNRNTIIFGALGAAGIGAYLVWKSRQAPTPFLTPAAVQNVLPTDQVPQPITVVVNPVADIKSVQDIVDTGSQMTPPVGGAFGYGGGIRIV